MIVQYDKGTIQRLTEDLSSFHGSISRHTDAISGELEACRATYTRLRSQIEVLLNQARRKLEDAESRIRSAQAEYDAAMQASSGAEEESDRQAASARASRALQDLQDARSDAAEAEAEVHKQQAKLAKVEGAWAAHGPAAETGLRALRDTQNSTCSLVRSASRDLEMFSQMMEQARSDLYGDGTASVPRHTDTGISAASPLSGGGRSGGPVLHGPTVSGFVSAAPEAGSSGSSSHAGAGSGKNIGAAVGVVAGMAAAGITAGKKVFRAAGWCAKNSMQAVFCDGTGKHLSLSIGGAQHIFSCDKNGLAMAYEAAMDAGEENMVERLSAMFEIETLREDLELQSGEPGFAQLGGYHRDVQPQDPAGYESHHIPARSVQDESAAWLPAIAITREDHSRTSSYRGKQNHTHTSYFSPSEPGVRYKDAVSEKISQGGPGYIEALRNELWDLRLSTGHRYDGGISAFLDAVMDMLATRGIPGSR